MSLSDHNKADIAFKNLRGFAQTSETKEIQNESERLFANIHQSHVWMSTIDPDPAKAQSGCIVYAVCADLVADPTSNGQAFFAVYPAGDPKAGQRVTNAVPPLYGDGYQAELKDGSNVIPVDDLRCWAYQYEDGVLFQQQANATPTPTSICVFVYTGTTLADSQLSGTPGTSGFSGKSGWSGASGLSGPSGFSGPSGWSGWSGASGFSGTSGFSGAIGISGFSGEANTTIGPAEDGTYTDGLFTDFTPTTPTGTAVDRFNEVLKALAPSPAPNLTSVSISISSAASGKMTFGATVPLAGYTSVTGVGTLPVEDIDQAFTAGSQSGKRAGITASSSSVTGTIADNVSTSSQSPTPAYPAHSFGSADQGLLKIEINGVLKDSVDLTNLNSITDSYFTLSAAIDVSFANGTAFDTFKYRTGTWKAPSADLQHGWNYIHVYQVIGGTTYDAGYVDFVWDADTTATSFASETLTGLAMTGSKHLSGVNYNTGGSATYGVTISNAYRNTWYDPSAVSFNRTPSGSIQSISSSSLPNSGGNEGATYTPSKTVSLVTSGIRFIDAGFTVTTTVKRTVQSQATSSGDSVSHLLVDNVPDSETSTAENFTAESWRLPSNSDFDLTTLDSGAWDSTVSLVSATAGYSDGLQVTNGELIYPVKDYATVANGPGGNVDYSSASGVRYFYRVFKDTSHTTANFVALFQGSGVTFIAASTSFTTATQMKFEMKVPTQTGWMDCYTDFATGQFSDGSGSRNSGTGAGRALNTNWGLTIGTQNTAGSANRVYVRITVPSGFTGDLTSLTFTFS